MILEDEVTTINIVTELLFVEITVHIRDGRDKYSSELHKNNEDDKRYDQSVDNKFCSEWDCSDRSHKINRQIEKM